MIYLQFSCPLPFIQSHLEIETSSSNIETSVYQNTGLHLNDFYFLQNGRKIDIHQINGIVQAIPRLCGGKGGFGSMLRAIGAQIEKTTNREACRDLSGRRLRDINEERRLKNWLAQKEEREREAQERKRKRLERMCEEPKFELKDEAFNKLRVDLTENVSDSIELGLQASTSVKRKCEDGNTVVKKPKKGLLFDIDIDSDMSLSSDDDEEIAAASSKYESDDVKGESSGSDDIPVNPETDQVVATT